MAHSQIRACESVRARVLREPCRLRRRWVWWWRRWPWWAVDQSGLLRSGNRRRGPSVAMLTTLRKHAQRTLIRRWPCRRGLLKSLPVPLLRRRDLRQRQRTAGKVGVKSSGDERRWRKAIRNARASTIFSMPRSPCSAARAKSCDWGDRAALSTCWQSTTGVSARACLARSDGRSQPSPHARPTPDPWRAPRPKPSSGRPPARRCSSACGRPA